jgi:hypothetical protein
VPRPAELGELEVSVSPRGAVDGETVEAFAALGVHRLILLPPPRADAAALEAFVVSIGERLMRGRA